MATLTSHETDMKKVWRKRKGGIWILLDNGWLHNCTIVLLCIEIKPDRLQTFNMYITKSDSISDMQECPGRILGHELVRKFVELCRRRGCMGVSDIRNIKPQHIARQVA